MKPSLTDRIRLTIQLTWNRINLLSNGFWLTGLLLFRHTAERIKSVIMIGTAATPGRVALGILAGALLTAPTLLYHMEHKQRLAYQDAYRRLTASSAADLSLLRSSVSELLAERARMTDLLLDMGHPIQSGDRVTVKVVATAYTSSVFETDNTPFVTAANTRTRDGVLAVSRDLLKPFTSDAPFSYGDRVSIPGVGDFLIEDTMHPRWNRRVDLWFPHRGKALQFGIQEVYLTKKMTEAGLADDPLRDG
jgi:3D (Asp-Asp-Asp) domain-containing protein